MPDPKRILGIPSETPVSSRITVFGPSSSLENPDFSKFV